MLVGRGMIASTFKKFETRDDVLVFASGVANSNESRPEAFERESNKLDELLAEFDGLAVYFGSLFDASRENSPYAVHKLAMERKIAEKANRHLIFRLPQVVGVNSNAATLSKYLADCIACDRSFKVQRSATRVLIDSEDMRALCEHHILDRNLWNQTVIMAPPPAVPVLSLVVALEQSIGKKGRYEVVEGGQPFQHLSPEIAALGRQLGLPFGPHYHRQVLEKYYGRR